MPFLCPVVLLSNTNAADTSRHLSGSFTVRKVKSGMTLRRQRSSRIPNLLLVEKLSERFLSQHKGRRQKSIL